MFSAVPHTGAPPAGLPADLGLVARAGLPDSSSGQMQSWVGLCHPASSPILISLTHTLTPTPTSFSLSISVRLRCAFSVSSRFFLSSSSSARRNSLSSAACCRRCFCSASSASSSLMRPFSCRTARWLCGRDLGNAPGGRTAVGQVCWAEKQVLPCFQHRPNKHLGFPNKPTFKASRELSLEVIISHPISSNRGRCWGDSGPVRVAWEQQ